MSERQIEESWEDPDKVGRGPNIPDDWKRYIMERALAEVNKPRMLLAKEILEQMKLSRDRLDKLPEKESIAKLISQARNHPLSPLDEQWSVGCLAQHDIPPEALPAVMHIYEKRQMAYEIDFTIREVLWIARLHKTIDDLEFLERFASAYSLRDKIDWILDSPVNTRGFDFILLNYCDPERRAEVIANFTKFPGYPNPFPSFHPNDSEEITEKLKQKGYDIEPPGMVLLRKLVEEEWQQAIQVTKQAKAQLEQKKPEELTEDEAQYLRWAKRFLKAQASPKEDEQ